MDRDTRGLDGRRQPLPRAVKALFLVLLLAVNAAGWWHFGRGDVLAAEAEGPPAIEVLLATPTHDLHEADRLDVIFDRPVVELGEDGEYPAVEAAPLRLEPAVAGRFEWADADRLAFLPDEPLGRCRRIEAWATAELERLLGGSASHTPIATWTGDHLEVVKAVATNATVETVDIELRFNADVNAEDLASGVQVHGSERGLDLTPSGVARPLSDPASERRTANDGFPFEVLSTGRSREHTLRITRPDLRRVVLELVPTLRPASGELGPRAISVRTVSIPRRFTIIDSSARLSSSRDVGTIRIEFSRSIQVGQEDYPVTVRPSVESLTVSPQGDELVLTGPFEPNTDYRVTVGASLLASRADDLTMASGETLARDLDVSVRMPSRRPSLQLLSGDGILSPGGTLSVALTTTAVRAVRVSADRVLPGNVVEHVRGARTSHTSGRALNEVFELEVDPDAGPGQMHLLDLTGLLGEDGATPRGIYRLRVASVDSRWTSDTATLRITDLAPTLKRVGDELHVWVRTLSAGQDIEGARVSVMTVTDQVIAGGTTDAAGYVRFPMPHGDDAAQPYLVLVEHGEGEAWDSCYTEVDGRRWEVPRDVAAGRKVSRLGDVFLYPERNLYRPGDTVHMTAIARRAAGGAHQGALRLVVERPDGAVVLRRDVVGDPNQGLFHADLETSPDARTGMWSARVEDPDSGTVLGRAGFSVEAFLPARLEASANTTDDRTAPVTSVTARSLAGTRIDGFRASAKVTWSPRDHVSRRFVGFSFDPIEDERSRETAEGESLLDGEGRASLVVPGIDELAPGRWDARIAWSVTEPGSRTVTAISRARIDTAEHHVGLRLDRDAGLPLGERHDDAGVHVVQSAVPFEVVGLAVDPRDEVVAHPGLWARLERIDRRWELSNGGHGRWERVEELVHVWDAPLVAGEDGALRASATCPTSGPYRVTIRSASGDLVRTSLYATDGDPRSFRPPTDEPEVVELRGPSGAVVPGDSVELTIDAPFDGSALVTLEDSALRWHGRVEVIDGEAVVAIPVPEDARGGAVVTVQVTRPLDTLMWLPHRAYGHMRLATSHVDARVETSIAAAERVRPGSRATVEVSSALEVEPGRPAMVHLWAVDEGIRLAGGHRAPDPHVHFFGRRGYDGRTTDAWFNLVMDLQRPSITSRIGGDGNLPGSARRRAPERVHVEPGVVWLEAVELGDDGRARFEVDVPDFTGELTWMCVVVNGDRYGRAEARTKLAGEIPMTLALPRFVAPGDEVEATWTFENQTEDVATVAPELDLEGPVSWSEQGAGRVEASFGDAAGIAALTIAPGERVTRRLRLTATGPGRITGEARLAGTFADGREAMERISVDLVVRDGRPLVVRSATARLDAGAGAATLQPSALLGLEESEELRDVTVDIGADPGVELLAAGAYLTEYPHGCAEQTASRVWALLAMPALAAPGQAEDAQVETELRVRAGLARLEQLLVRGGGVGYWPGAGRASEWASAYAAQLVGAAKELGYDVPEALVDELVRYGEGRLRSAPDTLRRAVWTEALGALGRPQRGWATRLGELADDLSRGERALVASAFASMGDGERALELILGDGDESATSTGRFARLVSTTRTAASELRTLLAVAPEHPRVAELVAALERGRRARSGHWGSTVDNAAALVALARYVRAVAPEPGEWTARLVNADGASILEATHDASAAGPVEGDELSLQLEGAGAVFVAVRGVGRAPAPGTPVDHGIEVRRRLLRRDGEELADTPVRVGDLVTVEVTLRSDGAATVHDVAIVDALPGGFEVENPRLANVDDEGFAAGAADRVEFLDDRVLIFASAGERTRVFNYHLRAVAAGRFDLPPVQAEAMYEPDVTSVAGATRTIGVLR